MNSDEQTRILNKINRSIPRHLQKGLVETKRDSSQEDVARELLKKDLPVNIKKRIERDLEQGRLVKNEKVVNQKNAQEIDRYLDGKIRAEMKSGRLKPAQRDAWMRRMQEQQKKFN